MPRIKLTKKFIEGHPVPAKAVELWDTEQRGLLCKITPAGKRVFMAFYRTADGTKRKPRIGVFGQITLEQARDAASNYMAEVVKGGDPSASRQFARKAPNVSGLCERYIAEYATPRNKPSYLKQLRRMIDKQIKPELGTMQVGAVTRKDVAALHHSLRKTPYEANRVLAALSVIFKCAELWELRPEGSNPCRLVRKYKEARRERLLSDQEVRAIYLHLLTKEAAQTETPSVILAIRLLFATAGRASEILGLKWDYIREDTDEIVWPDNKIGGEMRKPLTKEAIKLLRNAERVVGNPFVCVGSDRSQPLPMSSLEKAWSRILEGAGVPHCGLHAIRHRAATDIANDTSIPVRVAMQLTGHKTAATFMRYTHAERHQTREAAEKVSKRRQALLAERSKKVVPIRSKTPLSA